MKNRRERPKAKAKQGAATTKPDLSYYPPGELPKITQDELKARVQSPQWTQEDIEFLMYENERALRKQGYFLNSDREDSRERLLSAEATFEIIYPWIKKAVNERARAQGMRKHAGEVTGAKQRADGKKTKQKVLAMASGLLKTGRSPREVAGIISSRISLSASHIRKILAAHRKARPS